MNEYPKVSEGILGEEDTAKQIQKNFLSLSDSIFPKL